MLPPKRRINYGQVMQQVSSIRQLSRDTSKVSDNVDGVLVDTMRVWSGDAAQTFKKQCGIIIEDIADTAGKISCLANKIEEVAKEIEREDDAAERRYKEYCREKEREREREKAKQKSK